MRNYEKYKIIKGCKRAARSVAGLIGKAQRTTAKDVGKIHSLSLSATIHHQATDGAKNYHEDAFLNKALSKAALEQWDGLLERALELMAIDENTALIASKSEIEALLSEVEKAGRLN